MDVGTRDGPQDAIADMLAQVQALADQDVLDNANLLLAFVNGSRYSCNQGA